MPPKGVSDHLVPHLKVGSDFGDGKPTEIEPPRFSRASYNHCARHKPPWSADCRRTSGIPILLGQLFVVGEVSDGFANCCFATAEMLGYGTKRIAMTIQGDSGGWIKIDFPSGRLDTGQYLRDDTISQFET
jgi:hypothetical protein